MRPIYLPLPGVVVFALCWIAMPYTTTLEQIELVYQIGVFAIFWTGVMTGFALGISAGRAVGWREGQREARGLQP